MQAYLVHVLLPVKAVRKLSGLIQAATPRRGRPRVLTPEQQAAATLAFLRYGWTFQQVADGFAIGVATAYRYVNQAVTLLAGTARTLRAGLRSRCAKGGILIVDGTVLPCDRLWHPRGVMPTNFSGKHHRTGLNVQVVTNQKGHVVWLSPPMPGNTADIRAARSHGIIGATSARIVLADKAYIGAGQHVLVPHKGRDLTALEKQVNTNRNRLRGPGERGFAQLKQWKFCLRIRISPNRAHTFIAAIAALIYQQQ